MIGDGDVYAGGELTKKGTFLFGFLNQNLFTFGGDIKITQIQPIVSDTLNKKVSFAIGDAQTAIDCNQKTFVAVPLSFQVNYIAMFAKQPVRLFNPQYNVINSFGQRKMDDRRRLCVDRPLDLDSSDLTFLRCRLEAIWK